MESWHQASFIAQKRTAWLEGPPAEWMTGQLSQECNVHHLKNGGTAMECYCYLRNVHDKMVDGKTASEKRCGKKFDGPFIPFWILVEYIPNIATDKSRIFQFDQNTERNFLRLFSTCGERMVRWHDDNRLWRCARIRRSRNLREKIQTPWCIRRRRMRLSNGTLIFPDRPRPSLIAEGNFGPEDDVEIVECDEKSEQTEGSWSMRGEFFLSTSSVVMRDEYQQCLWTYDQWFMDQSEGCHYLWGVDWDCKFRILRTTLLVGQVENGEPTKIWKTSRPDSIWHEVWINGKYVA